MRLYSRSGATSHTHEGVTYEAGEDGAFDFPEALAAQLVRFHVDKKPLWETDIGRQDRLVREEMERRKDPATLLDAVNQIVAVAQQPAAPAADAGEVAELKRQLAELQARLAEKPAARRKPASAKTA